MPSNSAVLKWVLCILSSLAAAAVYYWAQAGHPSDEKLRFYYDAAIAIFALIAAIAAIIAIPSPIGQPSIELLGRRILASSWDRFDHPLPTIWRETEDVSLKDGHANGYPIALRNRGKDTAKGITLSWAYPQAQAVTLINALAAETKTPIKAENDGIGVSVTWHEQGKIPYSLLPSGTDQTQQTIGDLPAKRRPRHTEQLPAFYTIATSALIYLYARKRKLFGFSLQQSEIPTLTATIDYSDNVGKPYKTQFELSIKAAFMIEIADGTWQCEIISTRQSKTE